MSKVYLREPVMRLLKRYGMPLSSPAMNVTSKFFYGYCRKVTSFPYLRYHICHAWEKNCLVNNFRSSLAYALHSAVPRLWLSFVSTYPWTLLVVHWHAQVRHWTNSIYMLVSQCLESYGKLWFQVSFDGHIVNIIFS